MVIDARDKFAERAARALADLSMKLQGEGVDPSPELTKRSANYTPDFDQMVSDHIKAMSD